MSERHWIHMEDPIQNDGLGAYIKMPLKFRIPLIRRYFYWKLIRSLNTITLSDLSLATAIPKERWTGIEVGVRESSGITLSKDDVIS